MDRRDFLKSTIAGFCASRSLKAQEAPEIHNLTDSLRLFVGLGSNNALLFPTERGLVLVDSSSPKDGFGNLTLTFKIQTLFNTHYHLDQTGNNEMFAAAGAKIVAHEHTRQWMATDIGSRTRIATRRLAPKPLGRRKRFRRRAR